MPYSASQPSRPGASPDYSQQLQESKVHYPASLIYGSYVWLPNRVQTSYSACRIGRLDTIGFSDATHRQSAHSERIPLSCN
jgi:hypothetical protein